MLGERPASEEPREEPDTTPPDETDVDPGSGSPVPERDKQPGDVDADDDLLPAPTPGM